MIRLLRGCALLLLSVFGVGLIVASGGDGATTFSKSFGGERDDWVVSAVSTADGGYLFIGSRDEEMVDVAQPTEPRRIWVTKLNKNGEREWERAYGDPALVAQGQAGVRKFRSMTAAVDGGAWILGTETAAGGSDDLFVMRLDPTGQILWTRSYDSSASVPEPFALGGDTAEESDPVAVETAEGYLWIAARAKAFVRDDNVGVSKFSIYLLKLAADGEPLAANHSPMLTQEVSMLPQRIRALDDGGVAVTSELNREYMLLADARGQTRSLTYVLDVAIVGARNDLHLHDFAHLLSAGNDDGFAAVGNREDQSFVARYLASARDERDPDEGADNFELRPRENAWRIEIGEMTDIWAVGPACDAGQLVGNRCSLLVVGASRETPGEALMAIVDPDANVSPMRALRDIAAVCGLNREPRRTADGRVAYRLHALDTQGRSGTVVIDEQRVLLQPFTPLAGNSCNDRLSASAAGDGEILTMLGSNPFNDGNGTVELRRYGLDGALRWSVTHGGVVSRWNRPMAVTRTDDGLLIAAESGETLGGLPDASLLIKLDVNGGLLWQRQVPGLTVSGLQNMLGANVLAAQEGRYLLLGMDGNFVTYALQFARDGTLEWQRTLWQSRALAAGAVSALRDGGWLAAGGNTQRLGAPIVRLASSGQRLWTRRLAGAAQVFSLAEAQGGELYLGASATLGGPVIAKLSSSGDKLWANSVHEAHLVGGTPQVVAMPDGGALFATDTATVSNGYVADKDGDGEVSVLEEAAMVAANRDLHLVRFDPSGTRMWERRYGGRYGEFVTSMNPTGDGGALLSALSFSMGSRADRAEAWLMRLGPEGDIVAGCPAELLPNNFERVDIGVASFGSLAADETTFAPVESELTLQAAPVNIGRNDYDTPAVEARQCRGSVRSPSAGQTEQAQLRVVQGNRDYSGVVSSSPPGIICGTFGGGTCEWDFELDALVTLVIDPASRDHFESWSGCDSVSDDARQCSVRMTQDRTITVTFAETPRPPIVGLTINVISGRGAISGTGGIQCRATASGVCAASLSRGSTATLTATPDRGRSFLGWDGSCASFGNTRTITFVMNEGFICGARFSGPPPGAPVVSVQVNTQQAGDVTSDPPGIDCGAANSLCSEGFAVGTNVTLTARATQPGWEFDSFICQGTGRSYERSITLENLTGDRMCDATFSPGLERLYLRVVRDIGDTTTDSHVYVEGGGLDCEYDCDRPFERGRTLILRAEPWPDYVLSGWSGCQAVYPDSTHPGGNYYCQVSMDQRRDVVAFFTGVRPGPDGLRGLAVLYTPDSAPGRVTSSPGSIDCTPTGGICSGSFNIAEQVTLSLEPVAGSVATTHDGCDTFVPASGSAPALCRVSTVNDRAVTIGFTRPNNPPVAAFTFEPAAPLAGQSVTFNAGTSSDDNGIASYAWSFADNGVINATSSVASRTYTAAGTYTVRLTVTDGDGATDDEVRTIVVTDPSPVVLPIITLQPISVTVSPGATATFTVSANPGGGTLSYRWQRNGTDIPGATTESYSTPPTTSADDGAVFRVVVSNSAGSVVSSSAVLTVGNGWRPVGNALATPSFRPSLALNSAGTIYVSHTATLASRHALFVRYFNGSSWTILGGGQVDPASTYSITDNMLITGTDGYPILGWVEGPAARVVRWTGTQWDFIGNDLSIDTTDSFGSSGMQLVRNGNDLVAAWTETFGFPIGQTRIAVKRYNAATGTWSGGYVPDVFDAGVIRLALDSSGMAAVAYVPRPLSGGVGAIQVVRESASGWAPLGGDVGPVPTANSNGLIANYGVDIQFDDNDLPVVTGSADAYNLFAFRHTGSAWLPLTPGNGVFIALDQSTDVLGLMAMVPNNSGIIAIAYTHSHVQPNGGVQFLTEFLRWNGTAWNPVGNPLALLNYSLSPQLDGGGNPIMAGEYRPPGGFSEVVVRRFVP